MIWRISDSEPNSLPQQFDLKNANHVLLLDEIRERYSMALSDDTGACAQCMYKPASLLPYPKTTIRGAMNALLDFIEGRVQSPHLDVSIRSAAAAEAVKSTLVLLDNYLDIPASELPTEPKANGRVAAEFLGNGDA